MAQANSPTQSTPAGSPGNGQSFLQRYWWVIVGLIVAGAVVLLLAPAASENPDGLDRVSEDQEFAHKGKDAPYELLPDYTIPGIDNEWATVVLAGLVGVGIVFVVPMGIGFVLRQARKARS